MTYDDMNRMIHNYVKNDVSGRAIMLTGEWGSGKSYYIKKTLSDFLVNCKEGKIKCAIVSLYGMSETWEISKAIYLEYRTIIREPETEAINTALVAGKIIGKTIINGLVSKIGFDIGSIKDEDLLKVYESIDLSDKLIVLEDVERTKINTTDLFGYINNLCENDGAKVLVVTNENELMTSFESKNEKGESVMVYSKNAVAYMKAKEKTIGDTIHFHCDYINALQEILERFGLTLQAYRNDLTAKEIHTQFTISNYYNLRAFIYGCQKSMELFKYIEKNNISVNEDAKKTIFMGIVGFTQIQSKYPQITYDDEGYYSEKLGLNGRYPLFRFCFQYICYHIFDKDEITQTIHNYDEYRRLSKWNSGKDKDVKIIKEFYIKTEREIENALTNIPRKIRNNDISYFDYVALYNYLLAIKYDAEMDIDVLSIKHILIEKLRNSTVNYEELFNSGYELHNNQAVAEFNSFKQEIKETLTKPILIEFPYEEPAKLEEYYFKNVDEIKEHVSSNGFVHTLDMNRFLELLKICKASQINRIRSLLIKVYAELDISQIVEDDIWAFCELGDKISSLFLYEKYDKIQRLQIKELAKYLNDMILQINANRVEEKVNDSARYLHHTR